MIELYNGSQWDEFIALGHKMHNESAFKSIEFNEDKVKQILNSPNTFLALYKKNDKYIGFILAGVSTYFFSDEISSHDMAFFVDPTYRGGFAAVRLVMAYESWALSRGVSEIYLTQSTAINMDRTDSLYERLGYTKVGSNTKKGI